MNTVKENQEIVNRSNGSTHYFKPFANDVSGFDKWHLKAKKNLVLILQTFFFLVLHRMTVPVKRQKFKEKHLRKHATIIRPTNPPTQGLLISCNSSAETRAIGQSRFMLDSILPLLFPDHVSVWPEPQREIEIDLEIFDQLEGSKRIKLEKNEARKDRQFQAFDTACGGLIFYAFRNNVTPLEFMLKLKSNFNI